MASRREQKEAARRERERREEQHVEAQARSRRRHRLALVGVAVVAATAVIVAVALGRGSDGADGGRASAAHETMDHPGQMRYPPEPGSPAPPFSALDVNSGRKLTAGDLRGQKTLLFFSEGVACQACMVQAADLERSRRLKAEEIRLVSVTTDPSDLLEQAARQYGIRTPLLSDESRAMMGSWGQLGNGGMGHPDTGGHSFVRVDEDGKVAWEGSYGEMYVPTDKLLTDMSS